MQSGDFAEAAFGLFVGVTEFKDSHYVDKPLDVAARDAKDLRSELLKRFAWKENHIEILTGPVTREHVTQGLRRMKEKIRDFGGSAVFLLYISTHGHLYVDHAGRIDRSCLLAHNTNTSDSTTIFDTALTGPLLEAYVGSLDAAEVLVILDTCYADRALKVGELVRDVLPEGAGAAVLAAAAGLASYSENKRNSDSTETLLLALRRLGLQPGAITLARLLSELENAEGASWALYSAFRGALRIGFAGEAMESRKVDFETLQELAAARLNAYIAGARNYVAARYVPRVEIEANFRQFLAIVEDTSVFTIVGAAGSGKTTTSLRLAEIGKCEGFAVVWLPSSEAAPGAGFWKVLRDTFDEAGYWGSDVHVLEALRGAGKPLVVVLDAVNEWEEEASAKKDFLADCTKHVSEGRLKLVLTCRTRDWQSVSALLPQTTAVFECKRQARSRSGQSQPSGDDQGDRVSAVLGAFTGDEVKYAEAIFGVARRVDAPELRKQPIFARILSQLGERIPLPDRDGMLHFISVFDEFFNYRLERAAAQVAESADALRYTVLRLVGTMYERDAESLSTEDFLDLSKETIGLALLESGLFRRVGSSVALEAEMVHEYLLSLHLAAGTVPALKQAPADGVNRRLLQGAVLFDLVRIDEPQIVIPILEDLFEDDPFVAFDLMPRLSRITEYQEVFVGRVNKLYYADVIAEKLRFILERDSPGDLSFIVGVIRGVFHQEHYYDWEGKRWKPGTWEDFKEAVERTHFEPATVLVEAIEKAPEVTMRLLIREWLPDRSYLREGVTCIRDVGVTFLRAAGRLYPEIFAGTVQEDMDRVPSELWDVVYEVVTADPELFKDLGAKWLEDGRIYPGMTVLNALPEHYANFALEQVSTLIRVRALDSQTLQSLFGLLARYGGAKILRFLQESLQNPRLRVPALNTLRYMQVADPSLLIELVEPLLHEDGLDQSVLNALAEFYVAHMVTAPETAVKVFRQALKTNERGTESDIAWGVSRQRADHVLTGFVYERLAESPHHDLFELYLYYLRRLGPFGEQDLPWLRKSAASEGLPPEIADIAAAVLPFSEKLALLLLIEEHHLGWWARENEPGDTEVVRAFVRVLIDEECLASFGDEARIWLRAVANGKTWADANREVREKA